jgi:hypothetical protein
MLFKYRPDFEKSFGIRLFKRIGIAACCLAQGTPINPKTF